MKSLKMKNQTKHYEAMDNGSSARGNRRIINFSQYKALCFDGIMENGRFFDCDFE